MLISGIERRVLSCKRDSFARAKVGSFRIGVDAHIDAPVSVSQDAVDPNELKAIQETVDMTWAGMEGCDLTGDLTVEGGVVVTEVRGAEGSTVDKREYMMATQGGAVLSLNNNCIQIRLRSARRASASKDYRGIPLALGPSVMATLLSELLNSSDISVTSGAVAGVCELTVFDSGASPYPPQDFALTRLGAYSPDRRVSSRGRMRAEAIGSNWIDWVDYMMFTRPELWCCPATALQNVRRHLRIECARASSAPERYLVMESIQNRRGSGSAATWSAQCSLIERNGEACGIECGFVVSLQELIALESLIGSISDLRSGIAYDPILGNDYCMSEIILTRLKLDDILISEERS